MSDDDGATHHRQKGNNSTSSVNPIYRVMIESYTRNLEIEHVQTHCLTGPG